MSAPPVRSALLTGVVTRSVERERADLARTAAPEQDGEFTTAAAQSTPAAWNLQRGPAETGLPAGLPAAQGGGIAVESDHERNARLVAAAQASRGPDERAFGSPATQVGGDQRLFRVGPSPFLRRQHQQQRTLASAGRGPQVRPRPNSGFWAVDVVALDPEQQPAIDSFWPMVSHNGELLLNRIEDTYSQIVEQTRQGELELQEVMVTRRQAGEIPARYHVRSGGGQRARRRFRWCTRRLWSRPGKGSSSCRR